MELGSRVAISLEGTVGNIGAMVVKVGHHRLVHGTIPLHVSRLSESVSVHVLVVLMVDGSLSSSPLSVSIRNWRVLGQHTTDVPPEQVRVVDEGLGMHGVVVKDDGSLHSEPTTKSSNDKEDGPNVGKSASHMEILDGELTDNSETKEDSQLSATTVVGPVEVRAVDWSSDVLINAASGEPRFKL